MKKNKTALVITAEDAIPLETWLNNLADHYPVGENSLIARAATLAQLTGADAAAPNGESCLRQGLNMADVLIELQADQETIATALIYDCVRYADLSREDVSEQLGQEIAHLVSGVKKMDAVETLLEQIGRTPSQQAIDNLRKMLLAMVDDVRIVLIKLAERLTIIRHMAWLPPEEQQYEAKITQEIYAPLANRLGIGHLKWELEDLSFRYLQPEPYKSISKSLNAKRIEREIYVKQVIQVLEKTTDELQINKREITGRAKHIYSIFRKMQRKNVPFEEIYDVIAFRILVPTVEDCYSVLGQIHSLWKPIAKEFDDYISQPKANGYRSIHTAVIGPEDKNIEVQIRTFEMHEESELGVAAHWAYKEGATHKTGYEAKIAWLRQVLDWQKEVAHIDQPNEQVYSQALDDRIYVFTPQGDVIELPREATPLDFAYHIHSELGHRTRGAKVNGHMVPLTYALQIGQCVDILTTKKGHPSRDWLNPDLGYLKTSRAKAKVHHWLRQQDAEKNLLEGQAIVDKEFRRLGLKKVDLHALALKLNFHKTDDIFVAIGRGDITLHALTSVALEQQNASESSEPVFTVPITTVKPAVAATDIDIEGVGNLLTHMAHCCKPIPGDEVMGYVTQGRGVSIHRQDCSNLLHISDRQKNRLIQVSWGSKTKEKYPVDLVIHAYDRSGLIRDITQLLMNEQLSILALTCSLNKKDHTAQINLSVEVHGLSPLSRILARINQVPNVTEVKRL